MLSVTKLMGYISNHPALQTGTKLGAFQSDIGEAKVKTTLSTLSSSSAYFTGQHDAQLHPGPQA